MEFTSPNIINSLWLLAGVTIGLLVALWVIPTITRVVIERNILKYLTNSPLPVAYHVYNQDDISRFVAEALPQGIQLSEQSVERIIKIVRETYKVPYDAARTPPASDEAITRYLEQTGLLTEMGLTPAEGLEALRRIDPALHHLAPRMEDSQYYPTFPEVPDLAQVHLPAEYEPQGAVMLAWPIYYPFRWDEHTQFVTALAGAAEAHILVPNVYWQKAVELYLQFRQAPSDHIRFIYARVEDVWTRDFVPATVLDKNQKPYLVANPYIPNGQPYHKGEQEAPMELGRAYGVPVLRLPVVIEGGNLINDGQGTILLFDSVFYQNPDLTPKRLKAIFAQYFGAQRVILFPALKGEITGHIDMVVKIVDPERVMVAQSDPSYKWHDDFEAIAKTISETPSSSGQPYEVIRVPMAASDRNSPNFWSYINSLTVNHKVIIPLFGVPTDQQAIEIYRQTMPEYEVVGINYRDFPLGSVHCQSKEIPAALFQFSK